MTEFVGRPGTFDWGSMSDGPERDTLLRIFERMVAIRRFEEAVFELREGGHFRGHYHLYIGQEATGAAAMAALDDTDLVFSTHRNHGHLIARGTDPGRALAEIIGRAGGLNGGRGGTFHLADATRGMPHTSALVGGAVPLAAGAALAAKQAGRKSVGVAMFGDGALEEGVVFETLNLAKLWALPVVFVCENNTPGAIKKSAGGGNTSMLSADPLADVPRALKIESHVVDGADAAAVFAATRAAVRRCRDGHGPVFIEALTERWPGNQHQWPELVTGITEIAMAWDATRIPDDNAEWFRATDPVLRACRDLTAAGFATADELAAIDGTARRRMAAAIDFALASPQPDPATVLDHVLG